MVLVFVLRLTTTGLVSFFPDSGVAGEPSAKSPASTNTSSSKDGLFGNTSSKSSPFTLRPPRFGTFISFSLTLFCCFLWRPRFGCISGGEVLTESSVSFLPLDSSDFSIDIFVCFDFNSEVLGIESISFVSLVSSDFSGEILV